MTFSSNLYFFQWNFFRYKNKDLWTLKIVPGKLNGWKLHRVDRVQLNQFTLHSKIDLLLLVRMESEYKICITEMFCEIGRSEMMVWPVMQIGKHQKMHVHQRNLLCFVHQVSFLLLSSANKQGQRSIGIYIFRLE